MRLRMVGNFGQLLMEVAINDIEVMYVPAEGGPECAKEAFYQLEAKLSHHFVAGFMGHTMQVNTGHALPYSPEMILGGWGWIPE